MLFPLRDVIPPRTAPAATWALIGFTIVAQLALFPRAPLLLLAANMIALRIFGENVEDQMGHGRFLVFCAVCGATASLALMWAGPFARLEMPGTSGAVAGVMGAYFVMFFHSRVLVRLPLVIVEVPAIVFLALWALVQVLGSRPFTLYGPASGLLAGAALIRWCRRPERARWEWREG